MACPKSQTQRARNHVTLIDQKILRTAGSEREPGEVEPPRASLDKVYLKSSRAAGSPLASGTPKAANSTVSRDDLSAWDDDWADPVPFLTRLREFCTRRVEATQYRIYRTYRILLAHLDRLVLQISGAGDRRLIVSPSPGGYAIFQGRAKSKRRPRPLGCFHVHGDCYSEEGAVHERMDAALRKGCRVIAILPSTTPALEVRTIEVPSDGSQTPSEAVEEEIVRLYDCPVSETAFAFRRLGPWVEDGHEAIRMAAVPRKTIDSLCKDLKSLGLEPDTIFPGNAEEGTAETLDLLGRSDPSARLNVFASTLRHRIVTIGLKVLLLFALLNAGGKILLWGGLSASVEEARARTERAAIQMMETQGLSGPLARVAAGKVGTPGPLVTLDWLSRTLPDDTWLTELRVDHETVDIVGYARRPDLLAPLLAGGPSILAPRLVSTAPLEDGGGAQRFHIRASRATFEPDLTQSGNGTP